ncbi:K channel inward rectifier conserved region 2 domain protein [Gloeothece citriformis PCC 7424]|uniref:K channel inward rectifier conserved region 2 domain protein n=1 Tax=Gloeothece citriformis (strain PCC 7424) TaxID=65393 RepID=B7KEY3_GLOC7|nr:ion channel [Gloeothece citriformis]ACK70439.1 K channel inward rectifier conserved region 2 domain protein [Gloeothece citriformis PCC 7424]
MLPPLRFRFKPYSTKNRPLSPSAQKFWIRFDGAKLNIEGLGVWYYYWKDPYHLLLTLPWSGFLLIIIMYYVFLNTVFALAYLSASRGIEGLEPGSFLDAFFFSVHTLATIGYGNMYPTSLYANGLVALEALVSIIGLALITGLAFARFSQSSARILFSKVAVIVPYNGIPCLMFRAGNQRRNQILEAKMRVYLMWDEVSSEGTLMRRLHELKLLRNHTPSFAMTWTVIHSIDENSPLYQSTPESLEKRKAMVIVSLSGVDETIAQPMYARYTYGFSDILWDHQFEDVVYHTPNGDRYIDLTYFHAVKPLKI